MAPWPIEAGPEFVHGRNCELVRFAEREMGVKFGEKEWPDWWYFNKQHGGQGLINDEHVDDEIDKVRGRQGRRSRVAGRLQRAAPWSPGLHSP